jgi:hypothetical protein
MDSAPQIKALLMSKGVDVSEAAAEGLVNALKKDAKRGFECAELPDTGIGNHHLMKLCSEPRQF